MGTVMAEPPHYIGSHRILCWAAALTIAVAVIAVLAVREIAVRMIHSNSAFTPLSIGSGIIATVACTTIAVYIFAGMFSSSNSVRAWRQVATAVLIVSFLPNIALAISHLREACALMAHTFGSGGVVKCTCAGSGFGQQPYGRISQRQFRSRR